MDIKLANVNTIMLWIWSVTTVTDLDQQSYIELA